MTLLIVCLRVDDPTTMSQGVETNSILGVLSIILSPKTQLSAMRKSVKMDPKIDFWTYTSLSLSAATPDFRRPMFYKNQGQRVEGQTSCLFRELE
jgi:hypothetical protein